MSTINERQIESELDVDPVCGMNVYRTQAREHDLAITFAEREYVFCAPPCRDTFVHEPVASAVAGGDAP